MLNTSCKKSKIGQVGLQHGSARDSAEESGWYFKTRVNLGGEKKRTRNNGNRWQADFDMSVVHVNVHKDSEPSPRVITCSSIKI